MTSIAADAHAATATDPIRIVAAVIRDAAGRVLLVRKRGSMTFIQPGGKREPDEASLVTLARELHEELGVTLRADTARALGTFRELAVHEIGRHVEAEVYLVDIDGTPTAQAEIAELAWIDIRTASALPIAPLSAGHILPRVATLA